MGEEKDDKANTGKPDYWARLCIFIGGAFLIGVPIAYYCKFKDYPPGGPTEWSHFGSFFSGIATPVVAFCSAILFYRSLKIQRNEFKRSSAALERTAELQKKTVEAQNKANQLAWDHQAKQDRLRDQQRREGAIEVLKEYVAKYDYALGAFFTTEFNSLLKLTDHPINRDSIAGLYDRLSEERKVDEFKQKLKTYVSSVAEYGSILAELIYNDQLLYQYDNERKLLIKNSDGISLLIETFKIDGSTQDVDYKLAIEMLKKARNKGLDI